MSFVLFAWVVVLLPSVGFSVEYDTNSLYFEHWRHFDNQGVACEQCHRPLGIGVFSLPKHDVCEVCHEKGMANDYDVAKKTTCGKCHPKKRSGAITRLSLVPRTDKRYFFHSAQLNSLCLVCHGKMVDDMVLLGDLVTSKESRIKVRQQAHYFYNKGDCASCHKNMAIDSPPENHTADWSKKHKILLPSSTAEYVMQSHFVKIAMRAPIDRDDAFALFLL